MRSTGGNPPWVIIAVIVLIALFFMGNVYSWLVPLLLGGIGVWLVVTSAQGLRGGGRTVYWRGQRIQIEDSTRTERLARSVFAIALGSGLILFATWYLLLR